MRILVVCQYYYPEQFSITEIAEGFARAGHEVLVVTGKPNYGLWKIADGYEKVTDEVINGVRVHRCNLKPRRKGFFSIIGNYLSFYRNSRRYIKKLKEEFDVVYSMSLSPVISVSGANLYAKKHHVPHYLHCLDVWPESPVITGAVKKGGILYRILYRWSRNIYKKTSGVFVSSPSFETYFRETLKLPDLPITHVPQPSLSIAPSKEKPVFDHKHNFVYAGNIGTIQLVKELVFAAKIAHEKEDVCLHLIGMGSQEDVVAKIVKEENLSEFVKIYGPKPRAITASYYQQSDAIVVTLRKGGTVGNTIPNKLTSALELGKPILACIGGDGQALLEKTGGAVFAKEETPEGIAEAMLELASLDEKEKEKMGLANQAYFEKNLTLDLIVNQLLSLMDDKK